MAAPEIKPGTESPAPTRKKSASRRGRERALLLALLSGLTLRQAARKCGFSERSAQRYFAQPEFRAQLAGVDSDRVAALGRKLLQGAQRTGILLLQMVNDKTLKARDRISAARLVLESAMKLHELIDVGQRLTDLEQHAKGKD